MSDATNWLANPVTKAERKNLKAKRRKANDPITREWYAALSEGLKESPWYHDDNSPSLYRDRYMRVVAVAVLAVAKQHEMAQECLACLHQFRRQLPNTFATVPAVVRDWEAQFALRVAGGFPGDIELRNPEKGAELDGLNEWVKRNTCAPGS